MTSYIVTTRGGKPVAALVGPEDLQMASIANKLVLVTGNVGHVKHVSRLTV